MKVFGASLISDCFAAFSSFLLPFDTRLLLFFATAMDRDRALQHLQDLMNEGGTGNTALSVLTPDNVQRSITPRLERRKARFKHPPSFMRFTALRCGRRKLRVNWPVQVYLQNVGKSVSKIMTCYMSSGTFGLNCVKP